MGFLDGVKNKELGERFSRNYRHSVSFLNRLTIRKMDVSTEKAKVSAMAWNDWVSVRLAITGEIDLRLTSAGDSDPLSALQFTIGQFPIIVMAPVPEFYDVHEFALLIVRRANISFDDKFEAKKQKLAYILALSQLNTENLADARVSDLAKEKYKLVTDVSVFSAALKELTLTKICFEHERRLKEMMGEVNRALRALSPPASAGIQKFV